MYTQVEHPGLRLVHCWREQEEERQQKEKTTKAGDVELYFSLHLSFLFLILPSLFDVICCDVRVSSDDRTLAFQGRRGSRNNVEMGSLMDQKDGDDDHHHDSSFYDDKCKWMGEENLSNPLFSSSVRRIKLGKWKEHGLSRWMKLPSG